VPHFVHPRLRLVSECLNQLCHSLYIPDSGLYRSTSTNCATLCTPQTPAFITVPQPTVPHFVHPRLRLVSQCLNQLCHSLYIPDSGLYRSTSTNCATLCTPQTPACTAMPQPTVPQFVHPRLRLVSQYLNQLCHSLYIPDSGLYRSTSTNCATLCTPLTRRTIDNYCRSVRHVSRRHEDTARTMII